MQDKEIRSAQKISVKAVQASLDSLYAWVKINGWAGFDPYDVKGLPALRWMQRYGLFRKGLNVLAEVRLLFCHVLAAFIFYFVPAGC